jgi:cytochrome c oxidase subunit 3
VSSESLALAPGTHEAEHGLAAENQRLGFWMFLGSECVFFASLIGTYVALHGRNPTGPGPRDVFDIPLTAVATFTLLASSLTMGLAVNAIARNRLRSLRTWLVVTALLGLGFLGMQAYEFTDFWQKGLHYNTSMFSASFFTLTGFHGLHVSFGVSWIISLLVYSLRAKDVDARQTVRFETAGLYWHFVDIVWVVIFTVVYLMGVSG